MTTCEDWSACFFSLLSCDFLHPSYLLSHQRFSHCKPGTPCVGMFGICILNSAFRWHTTSVPTSHHPCFCWAAETGLHNVCQDLGFHVIKIIVLLKCQKKSPKISLSPVLPASTVKHGWAKQQVLWNSAHHGENHTSCLVCRNSVSLHGAEQSSHT